MTIEEVRAGVAAMLDELTVEELVEEGFDREDAVAFKAGAARVSSGHATARSEVLRHGHDGSGGRPGGASP